MPLDSALRTPQSSNKERLYTALGCFADNSAVYVNLELASTALLTKETLTMIDLFSSEVVEIRINHDGTKLWVNTNHGAVLRIYRIGRLVIQDNRRSSDDDSLRSADYKGEEKPPRRC